MKLRPLSDTLQEKAIKELFENPDRIPTDITTIRNWLQKQPHLQSVNPSDQRILAFLRGNKYSLARTKEKLDMSYTLRTIVPEIFQNRDPLSPKIQKMLEKGLLLPIHKCINEDGCRPILVRYDSQLGSQYSMEDMLKVSFMILEILIEEDDNFIISGEVAVSDMKQLGFSLLSQFTVPLIKKTITSFEKALPVRLKAVHVLNPPLGVETAYTLFKSFLSDKLKKRFFIHPQNSDVVYQQFSQEILPREYGGSNGNIQELIDYWKGKVESYRDWFLAEEKMRSNESMRPEKPQTSSTLFGIEGSFRKLEVD